MDFSNFNSNEKPLKINIDVRVITRDNLNDPDIQKLLALPSMTE
jgi:hypothetical protein